MPVATTEDELNDTAALTQAEVGVAMGANGKEVAKEVTEIVLVPNDYLDCSCVPQVETPRN